jgi:hypothetical protein
MTPRYQPSCTVDAVCGHLQSTNDAVVCAADSACCLALLHVWPSSEVVGGEAKSAAPADADRK